MPSACCTKFSQKVCMTKRTVSITKAANQTKENGEFLHIFNLYICQHYFNVSYFSSVSRLDLIGDISKEKQDLLRQTDVSGSNKIKETIRETQLDYFRNLSGEKK